MWQYGLRDRHLDAIDMVEDKLEYGTTFQGRKLSFLPKIGG